MARPHTRTILRTNYRGYHLFIWRFLLAALLVTLLSSVYLIPAASAQQQQQESRQRLDAVQQQIETTERKKLEQEAAAEKAAEQAALITQELVRVSDDITQAENTILTTEESITALEEEEKQKSAFLKQRRKELLDLVAALERLSRRPAALSLMQPGEAQDTARSAGLLGSMIPAIEEKAAEIRGELTALTRVKDKLAAARFAMKNQVESLQGKKQQQEILLAKRRKEQKVAEAAVSEQTRQLQALAREASSLQDLIQRLQQYEERLRNAPKPQRKPKTQKKTYFPNTKPINRARGELKYPATGRLTSRFNTQERVGRTRGIRIRTRAGSQVIAPYAGEIVFAGKFRDYGQLLIIAHGDGYHSLVAGIASLYTSIGENVLTGEPVGTVNERDTEIYLELRQKGKAIDPVPWLSR